MAVYAELIRLHKEEGLSFKNVITFNLDEYYPMHQEAQQSYVRLMDENLFNHIDIRRDNIHIPDGTLKKKISPITVLPMNARSLPLEDWTFSYLE